MIQGVTLYLCSTEYNEQLILKEMIKSFVSFPDILQCSSVTHSVPACYRAVTHGRVLPRQERTNTVGFALFGDSSSLVLLLRLDWCFPAPELRRPAPSASSRASPCPDRMLISTCFIIASSWRSTGCKKHMGRRAHEAVNKQSFFSAKSQVHF